jgi:hypothetical protein
LRGSFFVGVARVREFAVRERDGLRVVVAMPSRYRRHAPPLRKLRACLMLQM